MVAARRPSGRVDPGPEFEPWRAATAKAVAAVCRGALLAGAVLTLSASAAPCLAQVRPKIVSINLCADQLLLGLADPDQILGLSPYALDAARSWAAKDARRFPILSGTAEEVLVLKPDLVLSGRYTKLATRQMLQAQGLRLIELDTIRSLDDAKGQILQVGDLIGQPDKARAAVVAIDAAISRAREAATRHDVSALPLQRRGWVSGKETVMTSLLEVVGLRNAGAALNDGLSRQVTLEAIVKLRPDLLVVGGASRSAEDQGSALLQHTALRDLYPPDRRIVLPETLTVCGGAMLAEAIDRLAAEASRHGAANAGRDAPLHR